LILCLVITTWRGAVGASHYYGRLEEYDVEDKNLDPANYRVTHRLTAEEAVILDAKDGSTNESFSHQVGEESERFDHKEDVITAGKALARFKHGPDVQVYLGNRCHVLEDMEKLL